MRAEACCLAALQLKPDFAAAHNTLGIVQRCAARRACRRQLPQSDRAPRELCPGLFRPGGRLARSPRPPRPSIVTVARSRAIPTSPWHTTTWARYWPRWARPPRRSEPITRPCISIPRSRWSKTIWAHCCIRCQGFPRPPPVTVGAGDRAGRCKRPVQSGQSSSELGQNAEAVACFRRAIEINPRLAEAHFNLGAMLQGQGNFAAAIESYQNAIRVKPDCVPALNNLGTLYKRQDQLPEAIACYQRALEFHPDFAEVLNNLGNIFKVQGRIDEARVCYDQTLRIRPDYLQARCNRALMDLADGKLAEGWADYEYRSSYPDFPRRVWSATDVARRAARGPHAAGARRTGAGRHAAIHSLHTAAGERDGKLILEVSPAAPAAALRIGFRPVGSTRAQGRAAAAVRFAGSAVELARYFRNDARGNSQSRAVPVGQRVARAALANNAWRRRQASRSASPGKGVPSYSGDRFRSVPLVQFAPLALAEVELVSLQRGHGAEQIGRHCRTVRRSRSGRRVRSPARRVHGHRRRDEESRPGRHVRHGHGAPGRRAGRPASGWRCRCRPTGAGCATATTARGIPRCGCFAKRRSTTGQPVFARMAAALRATGIGQVAGCRLKDRSPSLATLLGGFLLRRFFGRRFLGGVLAPTS